MRYALLDLVACQHCHADLAAFAAREIPSEMPQATLPAASRVAAGPGLGPAPTTVRSTPIAALLAQHGSAAADPARNFAVEIEEGLLICPECGRWYPIIGQLPEILPDHLRDTGRDAAFFRSAGAALPADLRSLLERFAPSGSSAVDAGQHYKTAEMTIKSKIDDPAFFGPGYSSPFNPWNPEFTLYLISLFGSVLRVLELHKGETLLDSGCGYSWTTEWLHRSGLSAVGVDICRTYLEIGIERMGASRPHLVVGDVENLPLRDAAIDAVMAYESFHHIPDRKQAMGSYDRILRDGGRIVLAEPGGQHEQAEVSVNIMAKYGILERGMELDDVRAYAEGTRLRHIEQVFLTRRTSAEERRTADAEFLRSHSMTEGHLFRLARTAPVPPAPQAPHGLWPTAKRYVKAGLRRVVPV